jgi:arylsulfatase A-like enzyme
MSALGVVARAFAAMLAVAAGAIAWRMGGGADASRPAPRFAPAAGADAGAPSVAPSPSSEAKPGDGWEVAVRLVELATHARFDMPQADAAKNVLRAHWRQLRPPYVPLSGDASRFVSMVALLASATEPPRLQPVGKEAKAWAPDARVRGMHEAGFDQREALVSPAPGTIAFRVDVPRGARFTFAEGTMNATEEAIVFTVTLVDSRGASKEVYRHAHPPSAARKWTEASCDLSAYAGHEVELRLGTEPARPRGRADDGATATPPVALWGNPTILAKTTPRVPYNVLWIVVDALRPDVIASFHDDAQDAKKRAAPMPPLEALLPKVSGLTPEIDALARRGVRFTQAYSAASWTRPGTLAMLSGARSSELGIDTTAWRLSPAEVSRFYASDPPLFSLVLRRHGVATRAFVNNPFMVGYSPLGVDMGFERIDDHRYRTRDTFEITEDAARWIKQNKDTRFFAFVSYSSPHEPYEPPPKLLERVPPPPVGPKDKPVRLYMAEAAKDDEAIGVLMRTLDETGLRDRTIVVVTADHGETLSSAHSGVSSLERMPFRYHHAAGNFEETTRIPILIVAPGQLPSGSEVKARVRSIDIAPTLLELLGLEPHPRMTGKSLVALANGQIESEERVVVTEGRGSTAIMHGRWRLIAREGKPREDGVELYDLVDDPGERRDLAAKKPEIVAEMKARLEAAREDAAVPGAAGAGAADAQKPPTFRLRFVGGAQSRRVTGTITIGDAKLAARRYEIEPVELGHDAFRAEGGRVDIALRTSPSAPVGFDIVVDPPGTPITWELWLDDKPWPEVAVFSGPYGLLSPALRNGVANDDARAAADARALPMLDPLRDVGLFVVRERRGEVERAREATDEGVAEMARLLEERGYLRGASMKRK